MRSQPLQSDLCVIGGGTAGHALAFAAAALGLQCTLVDARERLGAGQAADLAERLLIEAARAHRPGTAFDLSGFRQRLGLALADAAPEHGAARLRSAGVTVLQAEAAFADPQTVVAGAQTIRARRVVLATGAAQQRPPWAQGLDGGRILSVDAIARWPALPDRLVMVLESPHGLAVAQALQRIGTAVTVIAAPGFAAPFDPELMVLVLAALERTGVVLHRDTRVERVDPDGIVHLASAAGAAGRLAATPMMVGRWPEPATAGLALGRAGIAAREGAPVVDAGLRTGNRRVFAIGDVLGRTAPGGATLPVQVGLVLRAVVFRQPIRFRPNTMPITIETTPGLAQVGTLAGGRRVSRFPLAAEGDGRGLAKIVGDARGTVLGAGLVGDQAAEAIGPWTLAVTRRVSVEAMAALPAPAGGAAAGFRRAALGALATRLRRPAVKRLIAWLRRLP